MIQTEIIYTNAHHGRTASMDLIDNNVVFDCSDGEYGPIEFSLETLERAIKEHKEKLNEQK